LSCGYGIGGTLYLLPVDVKLERDKQEPWVYGTVGGDLHYFPWRRTRLQ
jgi:hypothetical protein